MRRGRQNLRRCVVVVTRLIWKIFFHSCWRSRRGLGFLRHTTARSPFFFDDSNQVLFFPRPFLSSLMRIKAEAFPPPQYRGPIEAVLPQTAALVDVDVFSDLCFSALAAAAAAAPADAAASGAAHSAFSHSCRCCVCSCSFSCLSAVFATPLTGSSLFCWGLQAPLSGTSTSVHSPLGTFFIASSLSCSGFGCSVGSVCDTAF